VTAAADRAITTTVVDGGELGERKGINAPGVELPVSGLTDKDLEDLRFGARIGVDFIALSFVQSPVDSSGLARPCARPALHTFRWLPNSSVRKRLKSSTTSCESAMP
jgi:pyruvate kinase